MNSSEKSTETKKKTWGREFAFIVAIWFAYIVETKDIEYAEILILPVTTIVLGTFGLKRITNDTGMFTRTSAERTDWGRSERSGQYANWEREYPDDRYVYTAEVRTSECDCKRTRPDESQTAI